MEIRDLLTGGSFAVSLTSLAITIYWNILRGPKYISPSLLRLYIGCIPTTEVPIIVLPFIVTNIGGKTGVINSIYIDLIHNSTKHIEKFYLNEGQEPNPRQSEFVEEPAKPISVKSNESFMQYFTFVPHSIDYRLKKGLYELVINILTDSKENPTVLKKQKVEVLEALNAKDRGLNNLCRLG